MALNLSSYPKADKFSLPRTLCSIVLTFGVKMWKNSSLNGGRVGRWGGSLSHLVEARGVVSAVS